MGRFSDVLLTADFDRTLTATDSSIPERNLEAIRYFIAEGGAFTVNTGRSLAMSRCFLDKVPMNAPVLLYNGGAAYDAQKEAFVFAHEIPLPQGPTLRRIAALCREQIMEAVDRVQREGIPHGEIAVVFTPDEEVKRLIITMKKSAQSCRKFFRVCTPTE